MSPVPDFAVCEQDVIVTEGTLKQWVCFPGDGGPFQSASPQTFRLLVESSGGRIAVAAVALRTQPDTTLATQLAGLIDERQFALAARVRLCGEFEARYGLGITLFDHNLDQDDPLQETAAIPRALATAARNASHPTGIVPVASLRATIIQQLNLEWQTARARFIGNLDPEAVAQCRTSSGLCPSAYNYIATVSADHRRNRTQATLLFPWLGPLLDKPQFDAIRQTIDAGHPLIDALAKHYQAPKAIFRGLRGVTTEDLGRFSGQVDVLAKLLQEIPASWWPKDPADWCQFVRAADVISRLSRRPILCASNVLTLRRSAQNSYAVPQAPDEDLIRLGEDINEFIESLRRAITWTLAQRGIRLYAPDRMRPWDVAAAVKTGLGLSKLSRLVVRYGDAYRRAVTEFAEEAELWRGVRWPALGETARQYGSVVIQPLLTPAELKAEGRQMQNCVAAYVEQCMKGKSQIWSVRHQDGMPLATLETHIRSNVNGRKRLLVVQHKGRANSAPSGLSWQAVRLLEIDMTEHPEQMATYLDWKQTVSRQPMDERQRHAMMAPVITAMGQTLSGSWNWARIVEMACSAKPNDL